MSNPARRHWRKHQVRDRLRSPAFMRRVYYGHFWWKQKAPRNPAPDPVINGGYFPAVDPMGGGTFGDYSRTGPDP